MKATQFEFRFRVVIGFLLYVLGFWAPWARYLGGSGHVSTTWLELSGALASAHWLSLNNATILITVLALLCAIKGTIFRVWGTAYLGTAIVHDKSMHGTAVVASGPYRYVAQPALHGHVHLLARHFDSDAAHRCHLLSRRASCLLLPVDPGRRSTTWPRSKAKPISRTSRKCHASGAASALACLPRRQNRNGSPACSRKATMLASRHALRFSPGVTTPTC